MKVLFCTDGSKISFNSLHNFAYWQKDALIDAICVIDWSFIPEDLSIEAESFSTNCANIADGILEYTKSETEKIGMLFGEKLKYCGNAIESILEQAELEKYDLILMGSHGKKGLQKWLGSVSREIAYNNKLSTYISKRENKGKRVLFTTDGSESANYAIQEGIENLNLENKEIYLCTVNETPDMLFLDSALDTNWILSIENKLQKYAQETLDNLKEKFKNKHIDIKKSIILSGNPAKKIIDFSENEEIDLIIMGSKCKSKMQDFLLGSVSKKVLEYSACDILIYKNVKEDLPSIK